MVPHRRDEVQGVFVAAVLKDVDGNVHPRAGEHCVDVGAWEGAVRPVGDPAHGLSEEHGGVCRTGRAKLGDGDKTGAWGLWDPPSARSDFTISILLEESQRGISANLCVHLRSTKGLLGRGGAGA